MAWAADPEDEDGTGIGDDGVLFGAAEVAGADVFAAVRDEHRNVSVKTIGQEAYRDTLTASLARFVGSPVYGPTSRALPKFRGKPRDGRPPNRDGHRALLSPPRMLNPRTPGQVITLVGQGNAPDGKIRAEPAANQDDERRAHLTLIPRPALLTRRVNAPLNLHARRPPPVLRTDEMPDQPAPVITGLISRITRVPVTAHLRSSIRFQAAPQRAGQLTPSRPPGQVFSAVTCRHPPPARATV
jgi:hypothetical protein